MLARVYSSAVLGVDAYRVEVEVDIARGLPNVSIVGLPDHSIRESRDRVKSAVVNSGFPFPSQRITVNLAPADIRKDGTSFDLPMAIGLLAATKTISTTNLERYVLLGELSLDGRIKSIRGSLPVAVRARDEGMEGVVIPRENALEAAVVKGIKVFAVEHLMQAVRFLNDEHPIDPYVAEADSFEHVQHDAEQDYGNVMGQAHVKRAMEVTAAGAHNILLIGPPGSGKTMMARCLSSILPPLTFEEAIETTKIYSVVGLLNPHCALVVKRPFRAPHHTISEVGLVGGGGIPRPGEVSLSHNGVLFLDELPEFSKRALDVLRQPLEDRHVTISRARMSLCYPASNMLVAAMNPCPCGHYGDANRACTCSEMQVKRYMQRISGPLLDRIDIHVEVPPVRYRDLSMPFKSEGSEKIRERVVDARKRQIDRFQGAGIFNNAQMGASSIRRFCDPKGEGRQLLHGAMEKFGLSARACSKILKVARTIADLGGCDEIESSHLAEAIQYRSLDRRIEL